MKTESRNGNVKIRRNYHDRQRVGINFGEDSRTHQSFKDECDINVILKKYQKTGVLPLMAKAEPKYGEFADAGSYHDAMNMVLHAQEQFAALPSAVRKKFGNDPEKFLEFVHDPKNQEEAVKLGIVDVPKPDESLTMLKEIRDNTKKAPKTPKSDDSGA